MDLRRYELELLVRRVLRIETNADDTDDELIAMLPEYLRPHRHADEEELAWA